MTGLDLGKDALIEVAALVTDFELNVLGEGVDVVIKPPAEALAQMDDFVRTMHVSVRSARRARRWCHHGRGREAGARLHPRAVPRRRTPPAGGQQRRHRPRLPRPRHARAGDVPALSRSSTSRRSRSWPAAGTPGPTTTPPPRRGTTGRSPTSRRASRSCATTAPRCSSPPPARRPPRRAHSPTSTAAASPASREGRVRASPETRYTSCCSPVGWSNGADRDMVDVAQLVERRVVVADVAGSSPVIHPEEIEPLTRPGEGLDRRSSGRDLSGEELPRRSGAPPRARARGSRRPPAIRSRLARTKESSCACSRRRQEQVVVADVDVRHLEEHQGGRRA